MVIEWLILAIAVLGVVRIAFPGWFRSRPPPPRIRRARDDLIPGVLSVEAAAQGVLCCGGTGSAKTTGVAAPIALNALRRGIVPCVLVAKVDEGDRWEKYFRKTRRPYIRWRPGSKWKCDLLQYALSHEHGSVESAAQLLDLLIRVSGRESEGGGGEQVFWQRFADTIFRRAISLVYHATGTCSISDIDRVIAEAPCSPEQANDAKWRQESFVFQCLLQADQKPASRDLQLIADFWLKTWPETSEKTRSVGALMCSNITGKFLADPVGSMLSSGETNVSPDTLIHDGVGIICDMPVLQWGVVGAWFQIMFKTMVQRAVLRRPIEPNMRKIMIFMDEAQHFLVPDEDMRVQSVARQSGLIQVAIFQNLPMMYTAFGGGEKAKQDVHGLIGNYMNKFLCANSCLDTNTYMSNLLGHDKHLFMGGSTSNGVYDMVADMWGQGPQVTASFNEHWHPDVPPGDFLRLKTGGAKNRFAMECYFTQGGRLFPDTGKPWTKLTLPQVL